MRRLVVGIVAIVVIILVAAICIIYFDLHQLGLDDECIPGQYDVNNDGAVNVQDLSYINGHISSGDPYDMTYDMDCDGDVDQTDVDLCWENRD